MSNSTTGSTILSNNEEGCYCDPSVQSYGCNERACEAQSIAFLILFIPPLMVSGYRIVRMIRTKTTNNTWSMVSHVFLLLACLIRIIRSILQIRKETSYILMATLYLIPIVLLVCSYYNTLLVLMKIIYHVNFSKIIERTFPYTGKIIIAAQVVLLFAMIIGSIVNWPYYATNIVFGFYVALGAVGFAVFGKMIWDEYKMVSSKDCGVFSEKTHGKIQKVTTLSIVALFVTCMTLGVIIWAAIADPPLEINSLIAFSVVVRAIEISWIVSMLLVLSPSLQTWGPGNSNKVPSGNNFDDEASDASDDIGETKEDFKEKEKSLNDSTNNSQPEERAEAIVDIQSTPGGSDV